MKRSLGSSDSMGAFISICQSTDEQSPRNGRIYPMEFQSMLEGLDEDGCLEESGQIGEKKRRLSVDQVKALEKNFEVENKLEPERKLKLAQELGLQPRQVAVWFQNRRARWKTKQLERDYGHLKANYETLKHNYGTLQTDNEVLIKQIRELKTKLNEENADRNPSVKVKEAMDSDNQNKVMEKTEKPMDSELNCESFDDGNGVVGVSVFADGKDGSSDSDSSAIFNEDNSANPAISSSGVFIVSPPGSATMKFNCSSSSSPAVMNCFQFSDPKSDLGDGRRTYDQEINFVKIEEHNFFGCEEPCNFFSEEQAPTLQWCEWS